MQLANFFSAAPYAEPVNPKPITFTAIAKGRMLPGGVANPHGRPVKARVTGAFMFIGANGAEAARVAARRAVKARLADPETGAQVEPITEDDTNSELVYQILWRAVREWDPDEKKVGEHLFSEPDTVRDLVEPAEAQRILRAYNEYVDEEHAPEVVDDATFRKAGPGSKDALQHKRR